MKISNEPMIKKKEYSKEKYATKKRKSFGVAKRVVIMSELTYTFGVNSFVALGLFLALSLGTSALPYIFDINIDFSSDTAALRGMSFVYLSCAFMILFTIAGFWYAFAYVRLQIMSIHLDGSLEGAAEVSAAVQRGRRKGNYSAIGGPIAVAANYALENNVKMPNISILKKINTMIIWIQIILACVCVYLLIR